MERVAVNGAELAFVREGDPDGPTLTFVHGLGGSIDSWREQRAAAAAAGFDVIALDCRGAGASEKPQGPYSVEGWASDVVGLIDALGVERTALAGHSVGCMVAEHAAVALGERATALAVLGGALEWAPGFAEVLTGRAALAREGGMREVAEGVAAKGLTDRARAEQPQLVAGFIDAFAANDVDGYAEAALATARGKMVTPGELSCRVLALAGSEDTVTGPSAAAEIAAAAPLGRSGIVEGGSHWCNVELGAAVSAILLEFLQIDSTG